MMYDNTKSEQEKNREEKYRNKFVLEHFQENKVPVLKGCDNIECFCTGKCREIAYYREMTEEEIKAKKWETRK